MIEMKRGFFALFVVWALVVMACNMPAGQAINAQLERPGELTEDGAGEGDSAETDQPAAPTIAPLSTAVTGPVATPTPAPTTPARQLAPTVTPRGVPEVTIELPTPTVPSLQLEYSISWRLNENDTNFSFATVQLTATGGDEPYTFYRDGVPSSGPSFSYRWGSCVENPGSFRVDSADGQTLTVEYLETTPCSN